MQIHVVQRGDTLWALSRYYNVDMNQIIKANGLENPHTLVVGQSLIIPTPDLISHIVNVGDSLPSIAQQYGVSVQSILQANKLNIYSPIYPGQSLIVPTSSRTKIEVNSYTTNMSDKGAKEIANVGQYLTYLTPFTYTFKKDGTVITINDKSILAASKAQHIAPLLVLANLADGKFDSDLVAAILRKPNLQETLITNILNIMRNKGYTGLSFDFEYIYPEDRENYNAFLQRVVTKLHKERFSVSAALPPKVNDEQKGLLYEAQDYTAQGKILDFVILMTYEWGWAGGPPLAIAPINEVKRVLNYAVTAIPRNKIHMGIPLYGRDWKIPWVQGTFARVVSNQEAIRTAAKYGAEIYYHETYQSPFFRYTDETGQQHEVWFEDARSIQAKFDTVKQYGIRGISYWKLENQFTQTWVVQDYNFQVQKLL
ncbi:glycosyl hydrolase family 18 protein [Ectobacillus panaciterrae]|uniref:glycosyl hydrolase family 18 protein n=1 Tax=Ectobacillus panaciterrae TaxID=363872 RepID=UPI00040AE618|nr:glycosyl hydrolase family 18 protein [Ectobacillus panaciterrae]